MAKPALLFPERLFVSGYFLSANNGYLFEKKKEKNRNSKISFSAVRLLLLFVILLGLIVLVWWVKIVPYIRMFRSGLI